jgi:hypothetical protein
MTVAERLGISTRAVQRAIADLAAAGHLKRGRSANGNRYMLAWADLVERWMLDPKAEFKDLCARFSPAVRQSLVKMPYGEFLDTAYWKTIVAYLRSTRAMSASYAHRRPISSVTTGAIGTTAKNTFTSMT